MRRREFVQCLALLALLPGRARAAESLADNEAVRAFILEMEKEYLFTPQELRTFFSHLNLNEKVLRLNGITKSTGKPSGKPPKKTYWREYRKARLTPQNISAGASFARRHRDALARAAREYGVPPQVITAIIGIETRYGDHTGAFRVAEALATLAFAHPTRHAEFRAELVEFLLYVRQEKIEPINLYGSYAGAFGIPQFLPSSARKYAVDFGGDGATNLFTAVDAIGSVGNFLKNHGWQPPLGITYPVDAPPDVDALIAETSANKYRPLYTRPQLESRGVSSPSAPQDEQTRYVFIDLENRYDNEYRIGTANFYALTRYNRSFKYACVVADLAEKIADQIN